MAILRLMFTFTIFWVVIIKDENELIREAVDQFIYFVNVQNESKQTNGRYRDHPRANWGLDMPNS